MTKQLTEQEIKEHLNIIKVCSENIVNDINKLNGLLNQPISEYIASQDNLSISDSLSGLLSNL